jgi:hypothetical protein
MLELNGKPSSVIMFSIDFSFHNLFFFLIIWIFSSRNHLKINISHILNSNLTKWIPLNLVHQDLSNNTKGTFQFLWNVQLQFNLIFNEKIIQYSKTFALQVQVPWNQANAALLLKSFPKRPRSDLKHPGLVDLLSTNKTKQTNYLPSYIYMLFAKIWH